nr:myosin class II [Halisarca dujardinii]
MAEELKYLKVDRKELNDAFAQADWSAKKLVWIPDAEQGFLSVSVKETKGDSLLVELDGGQQRTVSKDDVQKMNPPKFEKVEDMAELSFLNEASVLHNLSARYYSNLIYTYSGLFCVVVNPYQWLKIYTENVIDMYKGRRRQELPPHVYAIADAAYRAMLQDREDQSILCTGESGAGKTENTKKVIQYLAYVAGAVAKQKAGAGKVRRASQPLQSKTGVNEKQGELEAQLLQANPILEAFGNAKTIKNDNSSRFGKFIRINFDNSGHIVGASIDTYLLEKSRAVHQSVDERTFHIFYQMLNGCTPDERKEYFLEDPKHYVHLSNGNAQVPGVNDSVEFNCTMEAMDIMGMNDEEKAALFKVVSSVLLFGNMAFKQERNSDQAILSDNTVAQKICRLLGLNATEFEKALLRPRIKTGRDYTVKSQNKEQVEYSTQALAKALYERMFKWVVARVNKSIDRTMRQGARFIGILDIAGFEIFQVNSFEQLCINYTNEKLQQLFNNTMFILEQEEYRSEGIDWNFIDFGLDLQPTIDLIEKPMGILSLLDEECWFPKATDKSYVEKLTKEHQNNSKFKKADFRSKGDFIVAHYAGEVEYRAEQWLMKNMDPLNDNVVQLLSDSSNWFVAALWKDTGNVVSIAAAGGSSSAGGAFGVQKPRKGMFRTVGQLYKEQLTSLMKTLRSTNPNFVRCIIPNHEKKAGKLVPHLILDQLRCNGVLEGIRICRQGFPNRILFQEFRQRYEILTPGVIPKGFMDGKKAVQKMVETLELDKQLYRLGHSKVFFRAGVLAHLEEERDLKLTEIIINFQAKCRGYLGRKRYQKLLDQSRAVRVLQSNIRSYLKLRNWPWWRLFTKVKPLLQVTAQEDENRRLTEENKKLNQRFDKIHSEYESVTQANEKIRLEATALQEELQEEKFLLQESDEMKNMLGIKKAELEQMLVEAESKADEEEEKANRISQEKTKLQDSITTLEEQLEAEGATHQRILHEKANTETRLKSLEEKLTLNEDLVTKLSRDKKSLDDKLQEALKGLSDEEGKFKNEHRQRTKLEGQVKDTDSKLERESKLKLDLEKENRKLHAEINELQEKLALALQQIAQLEATVAHLQRELAAMTERAENEAAGRAKSEKEKKLLDSQYAEVQEDLEAEKEARLKTEKQRKKLEEELESFRQMLDESEGATAAQHEIRSKREQELTDLKRTLEEEVTMHESGLGSMKQKHSQAIQELNDQVDILKKSKSSLEKTKSTVESQRDEFADEAQKYKSMCTDLSKKKTNLEAQLLDAQGRAKEAAAKAADLVAANSKLQTDAVNLINSNEDIESKLAISEKKLHSASQQAAELQDALTEETRLKLLATNKYKALENEVERLQSALEEEEESKQASQAKVLSLTQQLNDAKRKNDEDQMSYEELHSSKKKVEKEVEALNERIDELTAENTKLNKSRKKIQEELDDVLVNFDSQRAALSNLEKKQRKFDTALAEERSKAEKLAAERDAIENRARLSETKGLSLSRELGDIQIKLEETERARKNLQDEINAMMESKDDFGKNVADLEKAKRQLELEVDELKQNIEELEDENQVTSDAKLRLEINMQALKANYEKELSSRDELGEESKKGIMRQLHDLENQLEEERKQRSTAVNAKKKLESELADNLAQLELESKAKDEAVKNHRKAQSQTKELQQELEDLHRQTNDLMARIKELNRKSKNLEGECQQAKDDAVTSDKARRHAESERDELAEENQSLAPKISTLTDDKKRLENRLSSLDEDLEEEQQNNEQLSEKIRRSQQQLDSANAEMRNSQSHLGKVEGRNSTLEKQVKDLNAKVEELEAAGGRRLKAQLASLETKIVGLEDQLEGANKERQQSQRTLRRQDKKLKEMLSAVEDERKQADHFKQLADRNSSKARSFKKQLEEMEEDLQRMQTSKRKLQREVDELNEQIESIQTARRPSRAGAMGGSFSTGSRLPKRSGKSTPATNTDESYGEEDM